MQLTAPIHLTLVLGALFSVPLLLRAWRLAQAPQRMRAMCTDSSHLLSFWAWYEQVPPHYLGRFLRQQFAAQLNRRIERLSLLMGENDFVCEQRQRIATLQRGLAPMTTPRPGAEGQYDFALELMQEFQATRSARTRAQHRQGQAQFCALTRRLKIDFLKNQAERSRLLGMPAQARATLALVLAELPSAATTEADGVRTALQQLS